MYLFFFFEERNKYQRTFLHLSYTHIPSSIYIYITLTSYSHSISHSLILILFFSFSLIYSIPSLAFPYLYKEVKTERENLDGREKQNKIIMSGERMKRAIN